LVGSVDEPLPYWLQLKTEKIRVGAYGRTPLQG